MYVGLPAVGVNAAGNAGAGISATNNASYNQIGATLFGTISANIVTGNGTTLPGKGGIAIVSGDQETSRDLVRIFGA